MKNMLLMSTFPSFDDAAAAAGGGGSATAAPPPGGSSASGGAAAGAGAGGSAGGSGGDFSFFRNIPARTMPGETADKGGAEVKTEAAESRFVVNDDAGNPIEGASFATQAEADAYVAANVKTAAVAETTTETAKAAEDGTVAETETVKTGAEAEAVLAKPIYGRFKTIKEAEAGIQRMEREGVRLATENKKLKADAESALATRDAEIAAAKAETEMVRKTPPFRELTEEQLDALGKESPSKLVMYHLAKRDHEQAVQKAKDDAVRATENRRERVAAASAEIERLIGVMDADSKSFPMFRDMDSMMGEIHRTMGGDDSPLRGDPRGLDLYYRAAMGNKYIALLNKAGTAKTDATAAAKETAAATARSTAGAGAGAGTPAKAKTAAQESADRWSAAIDAAAPKRVLSFGE